MTQVPGPGAGHPVYGRPTLSELVAAVREYLMDAATGKGPVPSGYGARVAANALATETTSSPRSPACSAASSRPGWPSPARDTTRRLSDPETGPWHGWVNTVCWPGARDRDGKK
jgi:hypothetical protein